ncbi:hypothetical protein D6C84_00037 [Aureobasidium pullulans]|uniref:Ribosomal protein YMR-31 n=1 Tax=Aureobasidium pullulans TaxID=5580 RepID=A0A4S9Y9D8_AURPU|nr:hypothetical protein D6C84_00037 [Aureobasidium pullulans]
MSKHLAALVFPRHPPSTFQLFNFPTSKRPSPPKPDSSVSARPAPPASHFRLLSTTSLLASQHSTRATSHNQNHHTYSKMQATRILFGRQPMIRFLGKRSIPTKIDHTPHAHPAAPTSELPDSFASYRQKAQQHGPLSRRSPASQYGGFVGPKAGKSLGPVEPAAGEFFDRSDLPARFARTSWSAAEIEAIESGGASMFA